MQTLTTSHVVKSIRKAMEEKRLGAQCGQTKCEYLYDDGSKCAIGVSLDDDVLNDIVEGGHNENDIILISDELGFIHIPDNDRSTIEKIQKLHDEWAESEGVDREINRVIFEDFLDELEKNIV